MKDDRHTAVSALRRSSLAIKIPDSFEPISDARTAYFAGLIDGEGYVTLGKNSGNRPLWNVPTIVVAMCHRPTVLALGSYFKCGSVSFIDKTSKNPHWQNQFQWTVRWNDARRVSSLIRPFSITKQDALDRIINLPPQRSGPSRQFDVATVLYLRSLKGSMSYAKIGDHFGVGTMTAWKIINRIMYADIP